MKIPVNLYYSSEHLWIKAGEDGAYLAGITDYAQDLLGDIVFVDAPKVGTSLKANEVCGLIESVKTGSDLYAPLDGTVVAVNTQLQDYPEKINEDPYDNWIFKFEADAPNLEALLDAAAYRELIGN